MYQSHGNTSRLAAALPQTISDYGTGLAILECRFSTHWQSQLAGAFYSSGRSNDKRYPARSPKRTLTRDIFAKKDDKKDDKRGSPSTHPLFSVTKQLQSMFDSPCHEKPIKITAK